MPTSVILPHWVRADPAQERVLDAVGLTTVLDDCASSILPGISVLTRRARYFSFHCWARGRTPSGAQSDLHAWEVSLAHAEHHLHRHLLKDPTECSFLGKNNIEAQWNDGRALDEPTVVTQTPGWLAYRPALVAAGLVAARKPFALTKDGERLASLYRRLARPPRLLRGTWNHVACLSRVRGDERTALRQILGVQSGGQWDCQATTAWKARHATITLLRDQDPRLSAIDRLRGWCTRRRSLSDHGKRLVQAGAWSSLSFGMTVLLAAWVSQTASKRQVVIAALQAARRRRGVVESREVSRDALSALTADNSPLEIAVHALREALSAFEFLAEQRESSLRSLASNIVTGGDPGSALDELMLRHDTNKGPLAWTIPENRAGMPRKFSMPGIRIDALLNLLRDVGSSV